MNETIEDRTAPAVVELGADLSPAIRALEIAYRQIQKRYEGTPDATIVVKRDEKAWGHTTVAKQWHSAKADAPSHYEIMISGENLRRGAVHVAATLLHEAAHARDLEAGIHDTDMNGRHNQKFKARAEEHGLEVELMGWHGWAKTELGEEGQKTHARLISTIAKGLERSAVAVDPKIARITIAGGSGGGSVAVPPKKRGDRNLLVASCSCGHKIRLSGGVLAAAEPTCTACGDPFTVAA